MKRESPLRAASARLHPDGLFTEAMNIAKLNGRLAITARDVTLDAEPAGMPTDRQRSVVAATAALLTRKEAAPVAAALGRGSAELRALVGQHRAFRAGVSIFGNLRRMGQGWELAVDGAEALARSLVGQAVESLLEGGTLDAPTAARMQHWLERLDTLEQAQLDPDLQSRRATLKKKGAAQDQAEHLERQRQLLMTMAAVREGHDVDLAQLREAAQLYEELGDAAAPAKKASDRRGDSR